MQLMKAALLLLCTQLTQCTQVSHTANDIEVPCWLNQPADDHHIGAVGLARDLNIGGGHPVQYSRHRAMNSVAMYLGADPVAERQDFDIKKDVQLVSGRSLHFGDEFSLNGYVYSYASLDKPVSGQQCNMSQCDLSRCQPAWLCEPSKDGRPSLLGTSYRESEIPRQYSSAINNALKQLEPIYGLSVESHEKFFTGHSSIGTARILLSDDQVTMQQSADDLSLRYIVTDSCWQQEQLFLRVNFPDLPALSTVAPEVWMSEPTASGHRGAIGSVNGRVASGLLSDKVKLAIEQGLVELAKAKNIGISTELLNIERDQDLYQLSATVQDTVVSLHARVNGIHFTNGPAGIEVYAWLVETEGNTP